MDQEKAERYRIQRVKMGLAQVELAAKLGLNHSTVLRRENCQLPVTAEAELAMVGLSWEAQPAGGKPPRKRGGRSTPASKYRATRIALGMTQTQLADRLGLHYTTVLRREKGRMPLTREAELALRALGAGRP